MEKSRAIELLEHLAWDRDIERNPYGDALRMAIDALKAQHSSEGITKDATSDTISRTEVVEHLRRMLEATVPNTDYDEGFVDGVEFGVSTVSTMPTIQPQSTDLIDRQAAIDALDFEIVHITAYCDGKNEGNPLAQYNKGLEDGKKAIEALPPAQPEPQEGHWILYDKRFPWRTWYKCSECGNYLDFSGVNGGRGEVNFCPNCGAKMKGAEHEND